MSEVLTYQNEVQAWLDTQVMQIISSIEHHRQRSIKLCNQQGADASCLSLSNRRYEEMQLCSALSRIELLTRFSLEVGYVVAYNPAKPSAFWQLIGLTEHVFGFDHSAGEIICICPAQFVDIENAAKGQKLAYLQTKSPNLFLTSGGSASLSILYGHRKRVLNDLGLAYLTRLELFKAMSANADIEEIIN
jgi:hypothetical protein